MSLDYAPPAHPVARLEGDAFGTPLLILMWLVTAASLWLSFGLTPIFDRLSTDDAMRLVEVRDLLAGQSWFDLVQHRLMPPEGVNMHWSRLIDLPIALLIGAGETVLAPLDAERFALAAWPILLLLPTLAGAVQLGCHLADGRARVLALLMAATVGTTLVHFRPGAIDHHNAQIALLMWTLVLLARERPSRPAAAAAGSLAAVSLAIGLETLPAIAVIAIAVALRWIVEGPRSARETAAFGAAFAVLLIALLAVTLGPAGFLLPTCDELSIVQVMAGSLGGAGLCGLALTMRGGSWRLRLAGATVLGLVIATAVAGIYPQCLADPIDTDPRLTTLWLDSNAEARSVFMVARDLPQNLIPLYGFPLAALALAALALRRHADIARWPWLLAIGTLAMLVLVSLWLMRAAAMADIVAVPLLAAALVRLFPTGEHRLFGLTRPALVGALLLNQASLLLVGEASARGVEAIIHRPRAAFVEGPATCSRAADFAPLAPLPPSLMLGFIDSGPYILMMSGHSVLAAPYHRNVKGNGAMFDVFLSPPGEALRRLADLGVDYVAFCAGAPERFSYAALAPEGLAAALGRGEVPDFLAPVPLAGTPLTLYRVRR
jgi:hypothetical protein